LILFVTKIYVMKHLYIIFLIFISNAASGNKALRALKNGEYGKAFELSYLKVQQKTWRNSFTHILEDAYQKANTKDYLEIQKLYTLQNNKDYERIYNLFTQIKRRQDMVKVLGKVKHQKTNTDVTFAMIDCDQALQDYKQKTIEYKWNTANELLHKKDRFEARKANQLLHEIQKLEHGYLNSIELIEQSNSWGNSYVIIHINNKSNMAIPKQFEEKLLNLNLQDLYKPWIIYHTNVQPNIEYHYSIDLDIEQINISGNNMNTNHYLQTQIIKDGFMNQQDANGNDILDSLGNATLVEKFKTLEANIAEYTQSRSAQISGKITIKDNKNNEIVKKEPITYNYNWMHNYIEFQGDKDALDSATLPLTYQFHSAYPNDEVMLNYADYGLKQQFKNVVLNQSPLLK
jgi:hypothetical protein